MRMDIHRLIEHWFIHSIGLHVAPLSARQQSMSCPKKLEVHFSKTISYIGGNWSLERISNIAKIIKLINGEVRTGMTTWITTLRGCEKSMSLGFHRPGFQSRLSWQLTIRSLLTSTFSKSHALWLPWGVNQVNEAASLDICSVSKGIFHRDVSPDSFMAGLGSVPWKHSSCDETRMSSCSLSINHIGVIPTPTPVPLHLHHPSPLQPALFLYPKISKSSH